MFCVFLSPKNYASQNQLTRTFFVSSSPANVSTLLSAKSNRIVSKRRHVEKAGHRRRAAEPAAAPVHHEKRAVGQRNAGNEAVRTPAAVRRRRRIGLGSDPTKTDEGDDGGETDPVRLRLANAADQFQVAGGVRAAQSDRLFEAARGHQSR